MRSFLHGRTLPATLIGVVLAPLLAWTVGAAPVAAAQNKTVIKLRVLGCADCRIQPVQIRKGKVTFWGTEKTASDDDDVVRFRVPTARTRQMTFLVYAPFDHWAKGGIPLTPITRFKAKGAGDQVSWPYARKKRRASACWAGTDRDMVRNTLVIKTITVDGKTTAGGYFQRTMPSGRYWYTARKASLHSSDPSTCP